MSVMSDEQTIFKQNCFEGGVTSFSTFLNAFDNDKKKKYINMLTDFDGTGREETALHVSCRLGHVELAKYLVTNCKADINSLNNKRQTPLDITTNNYISYYTDNSIKKNYDKKEGYKWLLLIKFLIRNGGKLTDAEKKR